MMPLEPSCLMTINHQRFKIAQKLNDNLLDTIHLKGGNEEKARKIYEDCLAIINIGTMLHLLTSEEHDFAYEEVYKFFSGIKIAYFDFPELKEHDLQEKTVLDFLLIQKIEIQEQLNLNLKGYHNFSQKERDEGYRQTDYLIANERILNFAKEFSILKTEEIHKAKEILSEHRHNKTKDKKIIFIPENLYTKIN